MTKTKGPRSRIPQIWLDRLVLALKILIATGLILFLFMTGRLNFASILDSYKYPKYLFAGALCCTLAMVTPIFRWWILVRIQKLPLGMFDALRLTMIGYFFNMFIPGGAGGDVVRAVYTVRDCPERRAQALTIAFVDRGLGLHTLLLLGVSIILIQPTLFNNCPDLKPWLLLIAGMLVIGTIAALLLIWDRINGFMMRLCGRVIGGADAWHEAMMLYRKQPGMLFIAYFFSAGSAIFNVLAIHFMMLAVGSNPTIAESIAVAPLVILANALPFTPGGIGVAEGASAGLYAFVGQAGGANGMLLTRFFIVIHALLGFPFFLWNNRRIS
ncbi:MAG: lysylphosphatidylglycerol synthase transmembrane domain-containing protein [Thermodesulfobacteriota bacterium]|nr:lysylphosphatidylglycerol synthase transmembrane domain-containing protein [Thermodesulfobacteriota bacterium]